MVDRDGSKNRGRCNADEGSSMTIVGPDRLAAYLNKRRT